MAVQRIFTYLYVDVVVEFLSVFDSTLTVITNKHLNTKYVGIKSIDYQYLSIFLLAFVHFW